MTKDLERRLEAAEMCYIRRIMRISWTEKKSTEEVMEMAGYKRSFLKTIIKRTTVFWAYEQSWRTRKRNIEWKVFWYQKQRKTTHKIHRQSE